MQKKRVAVFLSFLFFASLGWAKQIVELKGTAGEFAIDPETLAVSVIPSGQSLKIDLTQGDRRFDEVESLKSDARDARWDYSHLKMHVTAVVDERGLRFLFETDKEQDFLWPVAGLTPQAVALIIPAGEGLYIPNHAAFWRREFKKYPNLALSMPFWAIEYNENIVSYLIAEQDEDTLAQVKEKQGQLYLQNTHHFLKRMHLPTYEVLIHLTGDSPISPALDYRHGLIEKNKFVSLRQKTLENANVNKLLGAFHIWVWGDGKSLAMLQALQQLGVKHCWLGYDPSPVQDGFNVDKVYVHTAENMGYLIAPYDSFDNAQNPKIADSGASAWPNHLWPEACIRNADGTILKGFGNRGCYLSAEALRLRESKEKNIANHVDGIVSKGENSLFLDCDAAYPLYEDYSKQHPMSRLQDLKDRLERMRYISSTKKLVLGSETGLSWASGVIAYNNGGFLTFSQAFWPCLRDRKSFGGWWPAATPNVLFKPYHATAEFIHASYDPRYRLPLYEAVFHDSVISTDRWELNELKIPAIILTKALLQNLYNIPPIWVLNRKTLTQIADYFSAYYQFFSPLHQMVGLEPLTRFEWLTGDHLVQQTQFGNRLVLTANFSHKKYETIDAGCIQAEWKEDSSKHVFCPKKALAEND